MPLVERQLKTMSAAVTTQDRHIEVQTLPIPAVPEGGALIRVTGCGVCGSDVDKLLHREITEPRVLGHEIVGVILETGRRVAVSHHVPCQTCHYCRQQSPSMCRSFKQSNVHPGGFAQYIAVSAAHLAHTVFPLPDSVSDMAGSAVEPLACCIRAVSRIPYYPDSSVLVIGLGFIGCLVSQVLQHEGFSTYGVDLNPERMQLALTHQWVKPMDTEVDCVFLTVVNAHTIELALRSVRDGGSLMLFSSGGEEPLIDQNQLYFREINVLTSYSPGLAELNASHQMICEGNIVLDPLFSHPVGLDALDSAIQAYAQGKAMKVFVTP
jgi:L-iditol 2-dehydrogenase